MEMDIGMNPSANFNKFQSLVWGEAIRKSKTNGGSATYGAAAGFAPTKGGKGRAKQEGSEMSVDQGLARFQEAVNRDAVYQKQTLGGQILQDEAGNPNYMLGAFRGGKSLLLIARPVFLLSSLLLLFRLLPFLASSSAFFFFWFSISPYFTPNHSKKQRITILNHINSQLFLQMNCT